MRIVLTSVIAVLIGLSVHVRATDDPKTVRTKVEYLVVSVPASPNDLQNRLNEEGKQGWVFVAEVRTALGESLVLRREAAE